MARYCLDTSWITNPLLENPPDVHATLWSRIIDLIDSGAFCWNTEIWEEMNGSISDVKVAASLDACHKDKGCYEVLQDHWDWQSYTQRYEAMKVAYKPYISELNNNRKSTVGLNDCSIVCLAKTLGLPVASMESPPGQPSQTRMRIPELCRRENVKHFNLTELFRNEGIKA